MIGTQSQLHGATDAFYFNRIVPPMRGMTIVADLATVVVAPAFQPPVLEHGAGVLVADTDAAHARAKTGNCVGPQGAGVQRLAGAQRPVGLSPPAARPAGPGQRTAEIAAAFNPGNRIA